MQFMLLFSRQGKLRLQKWYVAHPDKLKKKITRELITTVLARKPKMCSFLEWKDVKVVYKRLVIKIYKIIIFIMLILNVFTVLLSSKYSKLLDIFCFIFRQINNILLICHMQYVFSLYCLHYLYWCYKEESSDCCKQALTLLFWFLVILCLLVIMFYYKFLISDMHHSTSAVLWSKRTMSCWLWNLSIDMSNFLTNTLAVWVF